MPRIRPILGALMTTLLALALPATAPAGTPAPAWRLDAQAAGISSHVLPNGFKIILAPYPQAATARIELLVKVGSKQEGYGETGMAHLLEHMLFKSAGQRADLKSDLTALGATWNGTTTSDRTNYFETVVADPDKIDEAIRIEADRFLRPTFTREHLASEMTVVRNELERKDNDPDSLVLRALQRQAFFWHGYGRPTIGARSDIEGAPFEALQAFHRRHYRPDNAVLIVSGNFDSQRVLALTAKLFGQAPAPSSPRPGNWTREEARPVTNRSELFLSAGKVIGAAAWRLPGMRERDTLALDLASSALCAESWGSLRRELVVEQRLALGVSCGINAQPDYSLLLASATADKDADVQRLSRQLHQHVERFALRGLTAEQLERVRRNRLVTFERIRHAHEQLAVRLSQAEVAGDWRLFFLQRDIVETLTLEEINLALKKWLVSVNRSEVLLHHANRVRVPQMPTPEPVEAQLAGRDWPPVGSAADPLPVSLHELAAQVATIDLDGARAQAQLISRRTRGDLAWVTIANDFGNPSALSGRKTACTMASNLMAYGGAGLNREALAARLEALQARWSIGLGGIALEAPRANIEAALELLLAARQSPLLPPLEFERLKAAQIAGLKAALQDPVRVAANTVTLRFDNYPADHPLRPRSLQQALAEAQALDLPALQACATDFLGWSQVRLAMVGDFSRQDVEAIWARIAALPTNRIPYERISDIEAPTTVDDSLVVATAPPDRPNAEVRGVAQLRIAEDEPDFPALRIAIQLLGGDSDSRIRARLREREGLAYSAGASLNGGTFERRSLLVLSSSVARANAGAALSMLQEELARALAEGFSEAELTRAVAIWKSARSRSLATESAWVNQLAQGMHTGRGHAWQARFDQQIERLTVYDVNRALRQHLANAPVVWTLVKAP